MAQIFKKTSNALARISLFALGLIPLLVIAIAAAVHNSPYETAEGIIPQQPVPFSHKHHVGELKIDCRYCHSAVEDSAEAGMPTTEVCMGCHTQIWKDAAMLEPVRRSFRDEQPLRWTRVYDLPDFVFFDHSIHVHKGVGCVSCHGHVEAMPLTWKASPLTMEWCLECHNNPERYVRPRDLVTSLIDIPPEEQRALGPKLVTEYGIKKRTDCYVCHR